ncbi:MAG: hypothetical protein OJF47_002321 [Nitrospira sp.]|nr:MAG: hypothetical protein OJF47_002321 [Nitrospira sp.]
MNHGAGSSERMAGTNRLYRGEEVCTIPAESDFSYTVWAMINIRILWGDCADLRESPLPMCSAVSGITVVQ